MQRDGADSSRSYHSDVSSTSNQKFVFSRWPAVNESAGKVAQSVEVLTT